jgi:hypothetical protein
MKIDFSDDPKVSSYVKSPFEPKQWYFNPILTYYLVRLPSLWSTLNLHGRRNLLASYRDDILQTIIRNESIYGFDTIKRRS